MLFRDLSDFISMTTMRLRGASMNILKMCHEKDLLWYMTILEGGVVLIVGRRQVSGHRIA
jgi:hypothetical protein